MINARNYIEKGSLPIRPVRLDDKEYGRGLQRFIPVCADIIIIDTARELLYLANRIAKPGRGWWMIGGGIVAGTDPRLGAAKNLQRETGVQCNPDRFRLVSANTYRWKDRAQEPQDIGCHMFGYIYSIELTSEELEAISLDPNEYRGKLQAFDRHALVTTKVGQPLLDLYDDLFEVITC